MGVGITAYSRLRLTEHRRTAEEPWCENYEDHISAYAYACFARSFEGLAGADVLWGYEDGKLIVGADADRDGADWLIGTSCYGRTPETVEAKVLSMSYGGYNRWRDALSLAATGMRARFEKECVAAGMPADRFTFWTAAWDGWLVGTRLAADSGLINFH